MLDGQYSIHVVYQHLHFSIVNITVFITNMHFWVGSVYQCHLGGGGYREIFVFLISSSQSPLLSPPYLSL